jgi:uncharacterized protein (DUF362 family)
VKTVGKVNFRAQNSPMRVVSPLRAQSYLVRVLLLLGGAFIMGCGDGEAPRRVSAEGSGHPQGGAPSFETIPTVAILQSKTASASDLTESDILKLVRQAVALTQGLDRIRNGQTVVLKPNLVNTVSSDGPLSMYVNGITTDYRVTKAVATLVRERNPAGKILIMEGSTEPTQQVFSHFGYNPQYFGSLIDEFIAMEGDSCFNRSSFGLIQKRSVHGGTYWVNERYLNAEVVISIAVLKTHSKAGITGAVKNLGIGATPASQYSTSGCSRTESPAYIDHTRAGLGQFISEYYSIRKADFALIDGLQGIQNGPNPLWTDGGDYESDKMNMRVILAGKDAVAVDTIQTLVMGCDPAQIDHLVLADAAGLGVADPKKIRVIGETVEHVKREFKGPAWACGSP